MALFLHVAPHGSDAADGEATTPLRTIDRACELARPGDTVLVHAGEYREWVRPRRGGSSDQRRITYQAVPGERVVIKGSEQVTGWRNVGGTTWQVDVPNTLFGDANPFAATVDGDWIVYRDRNASRRHLGDVYLNGRSMYETSTRAAVDEAPAALKARDEWTGLEVPVRDPDGTRYVWYAEVGEHSTSIWANFQGAEPNAELVEINVRRSVFFPTQHHIDYITVRGFELAHAATPWAPPTADQPGLIGPNWAKGWIIEDNIIHGSKCAGISLGKESSTGHNYAFERGDKPGYQYQLESVFAAVQIGWDREHIGSHVVRRNTIFDCGQAGIVGHLGCVFSTIEDNHIYDIGTRREFYGYEIAGIKLHAAIDVAIRHNRIHDCTLGIWLDWQTQGTRISRNLLYRNNRDLFVEVSHGPYLVEHNVFASPASLEVVSQGGAYVNNLVCGSVRLEPVLDRATPYHRPHSTQVAGFATIPGGDDRYISNVFLGGDLDEAYEPGGVHHRTSAFGTAGYDGYPATFAEYLGRLDKSLGDHERFHAVKQPVDLRHNAYLAGATPSNSEIDALVIDTDTKATVRVVDDGHQVFLELELPEALDRLQPGVTAGESLGHARYPDAEFDEPDGSPARLDVDLTGTRKIHGRRYPAGPLAALRTGSSRVRVW